MNLAGQPTSRPAHRLLSIPHDACTVLMYADDRRVDHLHGGVMGASQCIHNPGPHARSTPANEAIVASGVRTECIRRGAAQLARKKYPAAGGWFLPVHVELKTRTPATR